MSRTTIIDLLKALDEVGASAKANDESEFGRRMASLLDVIAGLPDFMMQVGSSEREQAAMDIEQALWRLAKLRRPAAVAQISEALLAAGVESFGIRLFLAQGLVDSGRPALAQLVVQGAKAAGRYPTDAARATELATIAEGLLGRCSKDIAAVHGLNSPTGQAVGHMALSAYRSAGSLADPFVDERSRENARWAAVNVLTLRRWLGAEASETEVDDLSRKVIKIACMDWPPRILKAWDYSAIFEAHLAVNDEASCRDAFDRFLEVRPELYEMGGLLRQLEQFWTGDGDGAPSGALAETFAQRLRLAIAARTGSTLTVDRRTMSGMPEALSNWQESLKASGRPEAVIGTGAAVTQNFMQDLVARSAGVCQIVRGDFGEIFATGFVVIGKELHKSLPDEPMVLTCSHAVATGDYRFATVSSIRPNVVTVRFSALTPQHSSMVREVWHSPPFSLDTTLLWIESDAVRAAVRTVALPLDSNRMRASRQGAPQRDGEVHPLLPANVYVVGHPLGRDALRFSISNNALRAYGERQAFRNRGFVLLYPTLTEGGSSGSPVLDGDRLRVVGLHHLGNARLDFGPRADGRPYNEGVCIASIADGLEAAGPLVV